jgi:hypothetical protein
MICLSSERQLGPNPDPPPSPAAGFPTPINQTYSSNKHTFRLQARRVPDDEIAQSGGNPNDSERWRAKRLSLFFQRDKNCAREKVRASLCGNPRPWPFKPKWARSRFVRAAPLFSQSVAPQRRPALPIGFNEGKRRPSFRMRLWGAAGIFCMMRDIYEASPRFSKVLENSRGGKFKVVAWSHLRLVSTVPAESFRTTH